VVGIKTGPEAAGGSLARIISIFDFSFGFSFSTN
jgi:hypothetical protein